MVVADLRLVLGEDGLGLVELGDLLLRVLLPQLAEVVEVAQELDADEKREKRTFG